MGQSASCCKICTSILRDKVDVVKLNSVKVDAENLAKNLLLRTRLISSASELSSSLEETIPFCSLVPRTSASRIEAIAVVSILFLKSY